MTFMNLEQSPRPQRCSANLLKCWFNAATVLNNDGCILQSSVPSSCWCQPFHIKAAMCAQAFFALLIERFLLRLSSEFGGLRGLVSAQHIKFEEALRAVTQCLTMLPLAEVLGSAAEKEKLSELCNVGHFLQCQARKQDTSLQPSQCLHIHTYYARPQKSTGRSSC